ncbi:MAG: type III secretion system export apparatus subunit SctT [Deltaproteobacteria bacterium]|jgi:type III secretion protein T|nr:type III secretion system export apparatus subunit SctT [Deltaproteobacteria bacterium]
MELAILGQENGAFQLAAVGLVNLARLTAVVSFCPFLAGNVVNIQMKGSMIMALFLILIPTALRQAPSSLGIEPVDWLKYVFLAAKEGLIGYFISFVASVIFWIAQSAGFLIDNQRGASMAAGTDPLSGEETSPFGSFLFQGFTLSFFLTGGILVFLDFLYESYLFWPPFTFFPVLTGDVAPIFFIKTVEWLSLQTFLLAGPLVAACLLTDVSLGLINRFASQLNVYILAMPIKSGIASIIMISYYAFLINFSPSIFNLMYKRMAALRLALTP